MIQLNPDASAGIIEMRAVGYVSGADYDDVLIPAVEAALQHHDRIRLLCHMGPDFEGYGLDAAWDDTKLGLRHWNAFERCAVVTDYDWIRTAVRAAGFLVPFPIQVFPVAELEDARRWLRESLGAIHLEFEEGDKLVRVQLLGKLEPSAYRDVAEEIDATMQKVDGFRLLLDLRKFEGWESLSGLREHLTLVSDHHRSVERVAIVGDAAWMRLGVRLMSRFVAADARFFESAHFADAEKWVVTGS
jgi:hypothetical protein